MRDKTSAFLFPNPKGVFMCISCENSTPLDRLYMTVDMVSLAVHGTVEAMAKGETFVADGLLCAVLCLREAAYGVLIWQPEQRQQPEQQEEAV